MRTRVTAVLKALHLWNLALRFYRLGMALRYARSFGEAFSAFGRYLSPAYDDAVATLYSIRNARVLLTQGLEDQALVNLVTLAYGPETESFVRRNALSTLLAWGITSNNEDIATVAANHLSGGFGLRRPQRAIPAELSLLLEHYSSHDWTHPAGYQAFMSALSKPRVELEYATANFAFGMPHDLFGERVVREMQIQWLNHLLKVHNLSGFKSGEISDELLTIDALTVLAEAPAPRAVGPLVTILIPVFNGQTWLPTALDGLTKQTWRNIEVIVIDDCSTDKTRDVVTKWSKSDNRIRLIKADKNGGSYRARNIGIENSKGEFITVHDADDWSHPRKIEIQVQHLLDNPEMVANTSQAVRVENDTLHFYPAVGRHYLRPNFSSLLFRRHPVITELGYWDEVRFGADSEFYERIIAKFGTKAVKHLSAGPLSFVRYHAGSMTGSGYASTQTGISGIRRYYADTFKDWHAEIRAGKTSGKLGRASSGRPFAVAGLQVNRNFKYPLLDIVYMADLSATGNNVQSVVKAAKSAAKQGLSVGLIHAVSASEPDAIVSRTIRDIVNFESISVLLAGDRVKAKSVVVAEPIALVNLNSRRAELSAKKVVLVGVENDLLEDRAVEEFGGKVTWQAKF